MTLRGYDRLWHSEVMTGYGTPRPAHNRFLRQFKDIVSVLVLFSNDFFIRLKIP